MAEKGSIEAGIGSVGTTDENGAYTLKSTKGQTGAQTGKHRVTITKRKPGPEQDPGDDHRTLRGLPKDEVPSKYNEKSELTCEVAAGGKTDANFDLTSK
jgi:hypothetical protein